MAITKYIVDAMDGTISVRSEQGKGSEFHVVLDLEKAEERAMDTLQGWSVLVVDSDQRLCNNTVRSLMSLDVHAQGCQRADQAMEELAGLLTRYTGATIHARGIVTAQEPVMEISR